MLETQSKRKKYQYEDVYEEDNVDDLEFAANFAFVTIPTTDSTPSTLPIHKPTTRMHPEDTLDQDDQDSDSSSDSSDEKDDIERDVDDDDDDDEVNEGNNDGEVDSSEDDESDVDLSKELAQMENDEDEPIHGSKSNRIVVPKTQNELDVYNCPVTELEKTLDLGLELGDVLVFEPAGSGLMTARVQMDRIRPAGNIKFHMVSDRTIVVESNPQCGLASASNRYDSNHSVKKPLLLDEGNLLLLKITKDNHPMIAKITDGSELKDNEVFVVPLGKILEVFGPVSKPLYTLRLPAVHPLHERTPCKDALVKIKKKDNEDNDTTDLNELVVEKLKDSIENSPNDKAAETSKTIVSATKIETETVAQEHEGNVPIKNENIDPWSENGILTKWLKLTPKLEVFYCDDQVKVVDTQTVVKNSRKGCDASNIYDEEVTDEKEVYYSDDEEERAAKRGNRRQNRNNDNKRSSYGSHVPRYPIDKQNKRHPTTNPPYSHANPSYNQRQLHQNQQASNYPYHFPNPNVPAVAFQPIHQGHYTQFGGPPLQSHSAWMQTAPAPVIYTSMMNTGNIPPPPPPPPPPPRSSQQHSYNSIQSSQHQMYHQPSQEQTHPQMYHQCNNQAQQQQKNQNDGTSASGDTVYYNYSGS